MYVYDLGLILAVSLSLVVAQNVGQDSKLVTIAQGPVRGYKRNDSAIYEFFGVPYATAPSGALRFTDSKLVTTAQGPVQGYKRNDSVIYDFFGVPYATAPTVVAQNVGQDLKLVTTAQGPVRGYKRNDSSIYKFFGVPYATAPAGALRFTAPLPAPTWMETLEATDSSIVCPQLGNPTIQEDCLIANIFTPDTEETNLPVLVIIHGGAYFMGMGNDITPEALVETGKIIAVTFNYRLGAHGFLCLGTRDVPGNAGMKDQLALLRWVQNNIANFGGNPNDVTIAGYSAGSSSVDLLMLSKAAEGLFNKVIPESGAHLAFWSAHIDPIRYAQEYAKRLNFRNVDDPEALEEFYKTTPYEILMSRDNMEFPHVLYFSPCVERDFGEERFLEDAPLNIIRQGQYRKLPLLYGFTDMEGLLQVSLKYDEWSIKMNEKFSDFLPIDLTFDSEEEKETVAQTIKHFYFGDNPVGIHRIFDYINFFSDLYFVYPILRSARIQAEAGHSAIYLYVYTFNKRFPSVPGVPDVLINYPGAHHCAQTEAVYYLVAEGHSDEAYTEEYRQMRATMRELWMNFILHGDPVPQGSLLPTWPPVVENSSPHMHLGETIELRGSLYAERAQFWDQLYERYYRYPEAPVFPEPNSSPVTNIVFSNLVISIVCAYITKNSFI